MNSSVPCPVLRRCACGLEGLLEIGDAGEHRRQLLEMQLERGGQQPRDGCLAGTRRSPENDGVRPVVCDHAADGPIGSDQMILSDDFGERLRPQPVGQRPRRIVCSPPASNRSRHCAHANRNAPRCGRSASQAHVDPLAAPIDDHVPLAAGIRECAVQFGHGMDLAAVDGAHDIAGLESLLGRNESRPATTPRRRAPSDRAAARCSPRATGSPPWRRSADCARRWWSRCAADFPAAAQVSRPHRAYCRLRGHAACTVSPGLCVAIAVVERSAYRRPPRRPHRSTTSPVCRPALRSRAAGIDALRACTPPGRAKPMPCATSLVTAWPSRRSTAP